MSDMAYDGGALLQNIKAMASVDEAIAVICKFLEVDPREVYGIVRWADEVTAEFAKSFGPAAETVVHLVTVLKDLMNRRAFDAEAMNHLQALGEEQATLIAEQTAAGTAATR